MKISNLKEIITFQYDLGADQWTDYLTTHAYINGVNGSEFFIANAGNEGALTLIVECRYQPALMKVTPMQYRIKHTVGETTYYYDIISPADDIQMKHERVKFRVIRTYTREDGLYDNSTAAVQQAGDT